MPVAGPSGFLAEAQLSVVRALLGEITPEIRVVTVQTHMRAITVRVYAHGEVSDELLDDLDAAMTQVYADFPGEGPEAVRVDLELDRADEPDPVPAYGWPIFVRKGVVCLPWPGDHAGTPTYPTAAG
jgi:hypothetical protein